MSSQNEEILVEEPMVVNGVEVAVEVKAKKPKAKGFAARDKKVMYSILGFMILLKEKGLVDEEKAIELMEALPLYQTAAEKTAFFAQDVFDTKRVENEIYKPMVAEHKKSKKAKRSRKPKAVEGKNTTVETPTESEKKEIETEAKESETKEAEAAPKEKKPRTKKNKTEEEGDENKQKRGRKAKQQIVELQQVSSESVPKEDQLDQLINTMGVEPEEINVEDIDSMLQEMESEAKPVAVAEPVSEPVKKTKAKKVVEKEPGEITEKPKKVKKAKAVTIAEDAKPN
jgi:hypothetical protein